MTNNSKEDARALGTRGDVFPLVWEEKNRERTEVRAVHEREGDMDEGNELEGEEKGSGEWNRKRG